MKLGVRGKILIITVATFLLAIGVNTLVISRMFRKGYFAGLSLVKKIVEMYDGEVWVESEPGKGSTFFFALLKQETEVKNEKLQTDVVS